MSNLQRSPVERQLRIDGPPELLGSTLLARLEEVRAATVEVAALKCGAAALWARAIDTRPFLPEEFASLKPPTQSMQFTAPAYYENQGAPYGGQNS